MKYDEFVASFQNPETTARFAGLRVEGQVAEVTLAGTALVATKEYLRLDINGVQYEIVPSDVSDVQVFPSPEPASAVSEKGGKPVEEKKGAEKAAPRKGPQLVLLKLDPGAILCRLAPVQASLVAASGTWVSVVAPPTQAAEDVKSKTRQTV